LKPFNAKASFMNSSFTLPGSKYYATAVKTSGITANKTVTIGGVKYTYNFNVTSDAQQAKNEAVALKLVQKYYPDASETKSAVKIKLIRSGRQMRVENNALIVAHEAKAGFEVNNETTAGWSSKLSNNEFDVAMFAWALNAITQDGSNSNFRSDGSNNHSGWLDTSLDSILDQLEKKGTDAQVGVLMGKADKIISDNAWSIPMYQWPSVTGYSKGLQGIKPGPISPNVEWNYWDWHY
jgi:ABC-type transport system substrate-binding protein